jgi:DNA polymerase III epsilon subunit-like protein
VFPHHYGLPYRRSLRSLAKFILEREIQDNPSGHDSFEDAHACLELMLWKLRRDFVTIPQNTVHPQLHANDLVVLFKDLRIMS